MRKPEKVTPWRSVSGTALAWEGVAAITKGLRAHGIITWEIPYITEVVRPTPVLVKGFVLGGIIAIVGDHLRRESKVFG